MRLTLRRASLAADVLAVFVATAAAIVLRGLAAPLLGIHAGPFALNWALGVPLLAVLGAFYMAGLYERDAYMSRPLHAWLIARATAGAFIVSAAVSFLIGPDWFSIPRLIPILAFVLFVPLDLAFRFGVVDGLYVAWIRRARPVAFVAGDSAESRKLIDRLSDLRGFDLIRQVSSAGVAQSGAAAVARDLDDWPAHSMLASALFVDGNSVSPREITDILAIARPRGIAVYLVSELLGPLEGSRLLDMLFQARVTRVREADGRRGSRAFKRIADIIGAATILTLLSPAIAVLAAIIKLTSPGPVFYSQTRVGRNGTTFQFLKLRSMRVDGDSAGHEAYVRALIKGDAQPMATDADGNGIFKLVDDPRITPIGKFIRKYSLDEIPQLWNVLRGDMSLVGPRPPLPFEAEEYDSWQCQRLNVQSGITGVWQVVGRSRVSFDEMILQDLMYARNMRPWVDLCLCVWTIPAALLGGGGG